MLVALGFAERRGLRRFPLGRSASGDDPRHRGGPHARRRRLQQGPRSWWAPSRVLLVIFGFIWYLNAERKIDVLDGLGATIFVYVWVGVLGSYAIAHALAPHLSRPPRPGLPLRRGGADDLQRRRAPSSSGAGSARDRSTCRSRPTRPLKAPSAGPSSRCSPERSSCRG